MKTLITILCVIAIAACTSCEDKCEAAPAPWGLYFVSGSVAPHQNQQVPYESTIRVRIGGSGHAVQELRSGNAMLVEVFSPNCIDLHIGTCGESRTMTIAQASVAGVAFDRDGYGVLDAFPLTGNPFNSTGLPVGGSAVSQGTALQWSIVADAAGVTITLPGRV